MQKFTHVEGSIHSYRSYHFLKNRKTLWSMLREVWHGKYKMSWSTVLLLLLGVVYIILPFDFDWVPVIGWIDDAVVLVLLVKLLQRETKRYVRAKVMERRHS
ncbi:MAG: DUF1232 domain-containing protein [Bacteroidetes bacterium]|nr:DUF1232 domain-containing protein [Bacteroidota bacterium]